MAGFCQPLSQLLVGQVTHHDARQVLLLPLLIAAVCSRDLIDHKFYASHTKQGV